MARLEGARRAWLDWSCSDDVVTARLGGELDVASLPAIQPDVEALLRLESRGPIVVFADELVFIDSSGIAVLVRLANHFESIRLCEVTPVVRRIVEVLGLARRLPMEQGTP